MINSNINLNYEDRIRTGYSEFSQAGDSLHQWGRAEYRGRLIDAYTDGEFIKDSFTEPIAKHWQNNKTDSRLILDMGGGDGILLNTILQQLKELGFTNVKGINLDLDPSGRNLKIFSQKQTQGEYTENLSAIKGDIFNLPIKDNSIDIVVSRRVIQYFPPDQQLEFLRKINVVLTNEGLVIIEWPSGGRGFNELFNELTAVIMMGKKWQRDFLKLREFYPGKLSSKANLEVVLGKVRAQEFATPQSFAHRFSLTQAQKDAIKEIFKNYSKRYPELFKSENDELALVYEIINCQLKKTEL